MGYLHIDNLYKAQEILAFRECYALEKIHGTSANVSWSGGLLAFHSGGEKHARFVSLFDTPTLEQRFRELFMEGESCVVYGEAYGGKQQGMSPTYGPNLRFVAFDVKVGDCWLAVPQAHDVVVKLGLEFVDYALVPATVESADAMRDAPSTQAVRNGIPEPRVREGVVLRPVFEVTMNNGRRVIAKHKREEFAERGRPKVDLDPTKREKMEQADVVAREWVTPMRLEHVIDALISTRDSKEIDIKDTGTIIALMVADVEREASGEVLWSDAAKRAIGSLTAKMFKLRLASALTTAPQVSP